MPVIKNRLSDRIEIKTEPRKSINLDPDGANTRRRKPIRVISEGLIKKKPGKSDKK